jgi:hypothetical protein
MVHWRWHATSPLNAPEAAENDRVEAGVPRNGYGHMFAKCNDSGEKGLAMRRHLTSMIPITQNWIVLEIGVVMAPKTKLWRDR